MKKRITFIIIVMCLFLFAIGIIFWPTIYRYDEATISKKIFTVRFNRITGQTEYFIEGKWQWKKPKNKTEPEVIPYDECKKITGYASISDGHFNATIYNGSRWDITSIVYRLKPVDKDGNEIWNRTYYDSVQIKTLSSKSSYFPIAYSNVEPEIAKSNWQMDIIYGFKAKNLERPWLDEAPIDYSKYGLRNPGSKNIADSLEDMLLSEILRDNRDSIMDLKKLDSSEYKKWYDDTGLTILICQYIDEYEVLYWPFLDSVIDARGWDSLAFKKWYSDSGKVIILMQLALEYERGRSELKR